MHSIQRVLGRAMFSLQYRLRVAIRRGHAGKCAQDNFEQTTASALSAEGDFSRQLQERGHTVNDGLFNPIFLDEVRQQILALSEEGALIENNTHLIRGGATELLQKQGVFEASLDSKSQVGGALQRFIDVTVPSLTHAVSTALEEDVTFESSYVKVHHVRKGGSFPMHFDTDRNLDKRLLSCILYLNPDWDLVDGGELRLYPFPTAARDILPVAGRLGSILTESIASCSGKDRFEECEEALTPSSAFSWQDLVSPKVRKHALKLLYGQEWADSIIASHPPSPERQRALETHWAEVALIEKVFQQSQQTHLPPDELRNALPVPQGTQLPAAVRRYNWLRD